MKRKGKYVYMAYKDVEAKYGSALAKSIRKQKMELEESRGQDEEAWICQHPDIKNDEVLCCLDSNFVLHVFHKQN